MRIEQLDLPFATRYKPPVSKGVDCGADSLTHVECAKDCDINYLMRRYQATGTIPQQQRPPLDGALQAMYGSDYQALCDRIIAARREFDALPSAVRDRFSGDPAKLIAFVSDSANRDEAIRLGLISPPISKTPPAGGKGAPPAGGEGGVSG